MRVLALAITIALAACFSPDTLDGAFECGSGASECPPDHQCVCGHCWADTSRASCSMLDGAVTPIDARLTDARGVADAAVSAFDAPVSIADAPVSAVDAPVAELDAPVSLLDAPPPPPPDAQPPPDAHPPPIPDAPPLIDAHPPDAPPAICGDHICQDATGENCVNCAGDCGPCACDALPICLLGNETCVNCPSQCGACVCDGKCDLGDTTTCPSDCN